jgi:hypothetical protein
VTTPPAAGGDVDGVVVEVDGSDVAVVLALVVLGLGVVVVDEALADGEVVGVVPGSSSPPQTTTPATARPATTSATSTHIHRCLVIAPRSACWRIRQ